jgi:hypothetical protein
MSKIDVLYIHPFNSVNDYYLPMGLIDLMNRLKCKKIGRLYYEIDEEIIFYQRERL